MALRGNIYITRGRKNVNIYRICNIVRLSETLLKKRQEKWLEVAAESGKEIPKPNVFTDYL